MKKRIGLYGVLIGTINILLGSCGGILAVESLKKNSVPQHKAHATSIAVILPLSIVSAIIYLSKNSIELSESGVFIVPGLIGAVAGSIILPKINNKLLKKVFSGFIVYAGIRMLLK